ncbi:MAG: NTP transferase domain-containing protein [Desulfobacteraceae bacterium]|jgi:UDP-N-acetylglucosamine diphosphorylase/glucosamine-1-phosphate N-acetyltransferase
MENKVACIILAAGLGTRMKSKKAKVLHTLLDIPMVLYVVETANKIAGDDIIIVVGHQAETVKEVINNQFRATFIYQEEQLGTGHAVMCAMDALPKDVEEVLILCGDVPLLSQETLDLLLHQHIEEKRDASVLAVSVDNPTGYGRIILDSKNQLAGIVEEADANTKEKAISLINSGIYCIKKSFLTENLNRIESNNAQNEYYLTDVIKIGYNFKKSIGVVIGSSQEEIIGINSPNELKRAESILRDRKRENS